MTDSYEGHESEEAGSKAFGRRSFLAGMAGAAALPLVGNAIAAGPASAASAVQSHAVGAIASRYKNKTIGLLHYTLADENEQSLEDAVKQAAKMAGLNWKFKVQNSNANQSSMQSMLSTFVSQKVDAIILSVVPPKLVESALVQAKAAKIPVFGYWTFGELDPNMTLDYTGSPAMDAAALASYMCSDLYNKYPTGTIDIALVDTNLDILQARSVTVRAIAQLFPRINILDSADIDLTDIGGSATSITGGFLSKHSTLKAIWTNYPPTLVSAASEVIIKGAANRVGVYGHIGESAGLSALADPKNPVKAMSWVDFDNQSFNLVGYMLKYFSGAKIDPLASYEDIYPLTVFTKKTVKSLATGRGTAYGKGWTYSIGSWKAPLVASWKHTYRK
jgi:ABC-type sugar transport system substrate-binding protein